MSSSGDLKSRDVLWRCGPVVPYPCCVEDLNLGPVTDFLAGEPTKGVVSAYLFGSHAEGRAHRESDVDIGVLLHHEQYSTARERFDARLDLIGAIGNILGRNDVDLVVLNDAPPELGARIVTEGNRIFCSDEDADHAFVRDIQLRAADLAPFLERMRRIKLEAMKR